jgi:hypothetical protein
MIFLNLRENFAKNFFEGCFSYPRGCFIYESFGAFCNFYATHSWLGSLFDTYGLHALGGGLKPRGLIKHLIRNGF